MNLSLQRLFREYRGLALFILLLVGFRSAIADWNDVPTGSMEPTIAPGDRIFVNKTAYDYRIPFTSFAMHRNADPQHGDIIVFKSAAAKKRLVKRVIGIPGDLIAMIDNRLILNGHPLDYRNLSGDRDDLAVTTMQEQLPMMPHPIAIDSMQNFPFSSFAPIIVPPDHYFVLGDNRNNSADSRVYGFVPRHEITGKATTVIMSLDKANFFLPRKGRSLKSLYDET